MLKKIKVMSVICAVACGISFGKTSALNIADTLFQEAKKEGIVTHCDGDDSHATCYFKDLFPFQVDDMRFDMWLTDTQVKQEFSIKNISYGDKDLELFAPTSIKCEGVTSLKDMQSISDGSCIFNFKFGTLKIDSKQLLESKLFKNKTMPYMLLQYAKLSQSPSEYDKIKMKYSDDIEALYEEKHKVLNDIQEDIDMFDDIEEKMNFKNCGYANQIIKQESGMKSIQQVKREEKRRLIEKYENRYDEITKKYNDDIKAFKQSVIALLSQYNYTLQEVRIDIRSKKFAELLFNRAYHEFLYMYDHDELKEEQLEEVKKEASVRYYEALEGTRMVGISYINNAPYLKPDLKKSLVKIVDEGSKLFDPNSNKKSLKILITPKENVTINLGDELEKFMFAYEHDDLEYFINTLFNNVNKYDIKYVRMFPNQ